MRRGPGEVREAVQGESRRGPGGIREGSGRGPGVSPGGSQKALVFIRGIRRKGIWCYYASV